MEAWHDDSGESKQHDQGVATVPGGGLPEVPSITEEGLRGHARKLRESWTMLPSGELETDLSRQLKELAGKLKMVLQLASERVTGRELTTPLELLESTRMFEATLSSGQSALVAYKALPQVRLAQGRSMPRVMSLAEAYVAAVDGIWSAESLAIYVQEVQGHVELLFAEVLLLPQAMKSAQLGFVLTRAQDVLATGALPTIEQSPFSAPIHSLRRLAQYEWRPLIESMLSFGQTLRADPAGAFASMEDETRNTYYMRVADLARHADCSEGKTAETALRMAQEAKRTTDPDPRHAQRTQHVGYYLFAEGLPALKHRIGYHSPISVRLRDLLRRHNEYFYVVGIVALSAALLLPIIAPLVPRHEFWAVMGALLLVLLPVTQSAVDFVNSMVASVLKAESLPKMDYSRGIPVEASTMVVVPSLLLGERQVQELFEDLEARYLSNEDPHLHFALLTDLPDSPTQPAPDELHPLVQMAVRHTENLNAKYADGRGGAFLLLHRHRVFNVRQAVWMGWERKRGKLLDLNKLLLHEFDSFPIKSGPLPVLEGVRYVITLDADTQLPRSTAARMIGTMAHPLNRAIISSKLRIVTAGYGILQPRVGVSVASASRSRLAALYSGETGFDIYTRAVSDVYQDLFGEGIFTGKGIYEVSVLHQVLERRFPRNALLSHDLIEGAYVRAGLVTDVEVIDDYPSQYAAHTRRTHRWIRGDWQIMRWLFARVPDESGRMVANPISFISQWKIFDNLRRSLVVPVTFLMLTCGWFFLPGGAWYWTAVTFVLLLLVALVQSLLGLAGAIARLSLGGAKAAATTLLGSAAFELLNLTFLAHQMMLSLDAIVRTLNRSLLSGRRLLEWETAAQAESKRGRDSLDVYLQLSPVVALCLAIGLGLLHREALPAAGPVLVLWLIAPFAAGWLNSSPGKKAGPLDETDKWFLERHGLLLWRFYAEFSGPDNHWLIPDNVEEQGMLQVRKLSPTNLGMLLNARQAACELGFMTASEFAEATLGTLATYERLEKLRGHIFNWYDIATLHAIPPFTISTVDSGNLAASLHTLHTGTLALLKAPLLTSEHFAVIDRMAGRPSSEAEISLAPKIIDDLFRRSAELQRDPSRSDQDRWMEAEARRREDVLRQLIRDYLPWLLPQYASLAEVLASPVDAVPSPDTADAYLHELRELLGRIDLQSSVAALAAELQARLPATQARLAKLQRDLKLISDQAEDFAEAMEFGFLFSEARQLLSIGYDGRTHEQHSACYDLLASEARIASFLAVAKGDIPQGAWFRLDRSHVLVGGRAALLSWTGTMFEYMMPALWMRTFPDTLLGNSLDAAVHIQLEHTRKMPWGISESGFASTDHQGRYGYQAWGIPKLALKYKAEDGPVISPYSTFLALPLLRKEGLRNLRRMAGLGWTGAYGFYEAADYTQGAEPRLVRSWMAHHQGMSLLAVTNLLRENVFQTWFHASPRVRAAELLLHEKALSRATLHELAQRTVMEEV